MAQAHPGREDWREVCRHLRAEIESQRLPPGAVLPSLAELAGAHGLSLHGARRVYDRLRDEGRILGWQGLGYRVSTSQIEYPINPRTRFHDNITGAGHDALTEFVGARVIRAPAGMVRMLGLRDGARLVLAELMGRVDGRPMVLGAHHFPIARFGAIAGVLAQTGSVSRALARMGVPDFRRRETRITTRLPTGHEALLLEIPRNQPVLVASGVNVDPDGVAIELSCAICRGDAMTFLA
ncbi:GntR family transcriptional regulator [Pararhodobacter sp.]|uniref:GntR family transcriptional regulator n=1 Tax=Pararhodobacter sp. TaxID=2127056 RepID=UPI002FDD50C4